MNRAAFALRVNYCDARGKCARIFIGKSRYWMRAPYTDVQKMEDRKTQTDWHDEVKIRSKTPARLRKAPPSDKACAMQVWAPVSE